MSRSVTQYEVMHMENLVVRDDYWDDRENDRTDMVSYCEIYACKDCPRLGEECDGIDMEDDDEINA